MVVAKPPGGTSPRSRTWPTSGGGKWRWLETRTWSVHCGTSG